MIFGLLKLDHLAELVGLGSLPFRIISVDGPNKLNAEQQIMPSSRHEPPTLPRDAANKVINLIQKKRKVTHRALPDLSAPSFYRFGCLEVDRGLEFRRRLYWQISRFLTAQYAIDIPGGAAEEIRKNQWIVKVGPVRTGRGSCVTRI